MTRSSKSWRRHLAVGGVALAVITTACGGGDTTPPQAQPASESDAATPSPSPSRWDAVVAGAEKEGKVTLYSAQVLPILQALEKEFEATFADIDLEVVRGLPQDLVPKLEAERQTGKGIADVYVSADYQQVQQAGAAGYYADPVGPSFDAGGYDRDKNVSDDGYFLSHAVVFGWAWNTERVPDGLDSYEDLLAPELSGGKVGVVEASNQALTDFWTYIEAQHGQDFVEELAAQEPRIYAGGSPIQEALVSGEIAATVYAGAAMDDAVGQGAPVDWKIPDRPWGARYWGGALDIAPHPNAAQVLIDFIVSKKGQAVVAKGNASTLPDVPGTRAEITDVPLQDTAKLTPEFVAEYGQEWRRLFN